MFARLSLATGLFACLALFEPAPVEAGDTRVIIGVPSVQIDAPPLSIQFGSPYYYPHPHYHHHYYPAPIYYYEPRYYGPRYYPPRHYHPHKRYHRDYYYRDRDHHRRW